MYVPGLNDDLRDVPIVEPVLPWTGQPDGNDDGYREVDLHPGDEMDPDPLVPLNSLFHCAPTYADGEFPGVALWPGIGGSSTMLFRAPGVRSLALVDHDLRRYERTVLCVDAYRPPEVQRDLWLDVLNTRVIPGRLVTDLSPEELWQFGNTADDTAAYYRVARNEAYLPRFDALRSGPEWMFLDSVRGDNDINMAALKYLSYRQNAGLEPTLVLDLDAVTAHGSASALDAYSLNANTGRPVCLGVPFDFTSSNPNHVKWAQMAAFEKYPWEEFEEAVRNNTLLARYMRELNLEPTRQVFRIIQRERRIFFWAFKRRGWSHYTGECWHFNAPNTEGGKQSLEVPGGGNACHSLLVNARDTSGKVVAVWTNRKAYELSRPYYN